MMQLLEIPDFSTNFGVFYLFIAVTVIQDKISFIMLWYTKMNWNRYHNNKKLAEIGVLDGASIFAQKHSTEDNLP